ncbi:hypothetical protein EG68_09977, partial [Paragonimus skrjabini miyazakii]
ILFFVLFIAAALRVQENIPCGHWISTFSAWHGTMCNEISEKICFVCSITCIVASVYSFSVRPAVILYLFSALFVLCMILRVISYWRSNYLLFMLDMCYLINALSLILVWGLPTSHRLQSVQFGLANSHAYCGAFLYRNAVVFHDFQKLVSSFIHILPVLFSFLLRWFPKETSVWWYTNLVDTNAKADPLVWMNDRDWFYLMLVPLLVFCFREILYYLIVYGCVKPDEKHLDSYRYMHKKKLFAQIFWDRFHARWHILIWVMFGIVASGVVLCLAAIAWSSYLFHSLMLIVQLLMICWNGACYYIDYYPVELQRRFTSQVTEANNCYEKSHNEKAVDPNGYNSDPPGSLLSRLLPTETDSLNDRTEDGRVRRVSVCLPANTVMMIEPADVANRVRL